MKTKQQNNKYIKRSQLSAVHKHACYKIIINIIIRLIRSFHLTLYKLFLSDTSSRHRTRRITRLLLIKRYYSTTTVVNILSSNETLTRNNRTKSERIITNDEVDTIPAGIPVGSTCGIEQEGRIILYRLRS